LFLGFAQFMARQPEYRMPPVKTRRKQLEHAHPLIAATQMSEFVEEKCTLLVSVKRRP
jgi:hypothetical protein